MKRPVLFREDSGSAAVEFALVLPLVALLMMAILQAGLTARARILVVQAAREGARQATTTEDDSEIHAAALAAAGGLNGDLLSVTYAAPEGWKCGSPVTVRVSYTVPCVFPGLVKVWPGSLYLTEATTMRLEKDR